MVVARLIQGLAGAGLWTFSLAFLADNVDPARAGSLSGMALTGAPVRTRLLELFRGR